RGQRLWGLRSSCPRDGPGYADQGLRVAGRRYLLVYRDLQRGRVAWRACDRNRPTQGHHGRVLGIGRAYPRTEEKPQACCQESTHSMFPVAQGAVTNAIHAVRDLAPCTTCYRHGGAKWNRCLPVARVLAPLHRVIRPTQPAPAQSLIKGRNDEM